MNLVELFILAIGLSMDAFAVSICKGLSLGKISKKHMFLAGAWFGGFQALMPLIGYFLGNFFTDMITKYAHWIAFILLAIIGGNMIKEALGEDEQVNACMDAKEMFLLAVATSIDALAVGVTFAFLKVAIVPAVSFIGCVTFVCSAIGGGCGRFLGPELSNSKTASILHRTQEHPVPVPGKKVRVVGTNGSLTGYAGGIDKKIALLELEHTNMSDFFVPKKGTTL